LLTPAIETPNIAFMKTTWSAVWRLAVSLGVSLLILGLVFHLVGKGSDQVSTAQILDVLRKVSLPLTLAALGCLAGQTMLRAARYRLLLRADGHARLPRFLPLLLATAARNMFIDLLPARLGEFSYVALLNRGCGVVGSACVSSMALSLFLDFTALLLLVLGLAGWFLVSASLPGWLLTAIVALALVTMIMAAALFWGVRQGALWCARWFPRLAAWRPAAWALAFARDLADSLARARAAGILLPALGLSLGVRLFKYTGFYLLFLAVTAASLPEMAKARAFEVILALLSAEAAAGLPLPSFMSFGTYETGGLLCLVALGYAASDSVLAMFSIHMVSQIMDYAVGGLALAFFFLLRPATAAAGAGTSTIPAALPARRGPLALLAASLAVLLASGAFLGFEALRLRKLGSLRPPEAGHAVVADRSGEDRARTVVAELKGFVVWSSNRDGSHDIWKLTLPDLALTPLTRHPHAEYFPRVAPDGTRLAFCRSRIPWVSQRNSTDWDVLILDLATGAETVIASNAVAPSWSPDGKRLFFLRQGTACVERQVDSGLERVLFEAGTPPVPANVRLETPSVHSRTGILAATLRGGRRELALFEPGGSMVRLGDQGKGCQLFWSPDETFLYFVLSQGGNMKNRFMRYDPAARSASEWFDMPGDWSHEYFPKLSADGRWLVFGACSEGHEHDTADYEIFLWPVGAPADQAVRLTWHSGNDNWPDIFLETAKEAPLAKP
jgi:uncharacterized membrane protein YbhN (UPF0104 family)